MNALALLSGGLDSAVAVEICKPDVRLCVGFDYGQPHKIELQYAERIAADAGVPFRIIALPVIEKVDDVVFAARNAVLIAVAASIAMREGLDAIVIGCNFSDWERFPDCRPAFVKAMNEVLAAYGISLIGPLLRKTKAEVAQMARELGVGATWSCYQPKGDKPCGECLACRVRTEAGA